MKSRAQNRYDTEFFARDLLYCRLNKRCFDFLVGERERLNEQGYILPGLGDAGDRIYGTK